MDINNVKWDCKGLIPAVIQDDSSMNVLMIGYMNSKSLEITVKTNEVTFYSRSKQKLWTKGETSGNKLVVKSIELDCDNDTLLIKAIPLGPTCHKENYSCFENETRNPLYIIDVLEKIVDKRMEEFTHILNNRYLRINDYLDDNSLDNTSNENILKLKETGKKWFLKYIHLLNEFFQL